MAKRHLILGALLALAPLWAQHPPPAAGAPPIPYPRYDDEGHAPLMPETARFTVLSTEPLDNLCYKVYPQDKKRPPYYRSLAIPARQRTSFYSFNGGNPLELFWYQDETTPPEPALSVNLPKGVHSHMLAIRTRPNAKNPSRPALECSQINVDKKAFPAGSYVIVNLVDVPLAGVIDGELLKPISTTLTPKRARNGGLDVYAYIEDDNSVINVVRSKLALLNTHRYWICFFPVSKDGRTKVLYSLLREPMVIDAIEGEAVQRLMDENLEAP